VFLQAELHHTVPCRFRRNMPQYTAKATYINVYNTQDNAQRRAALRLV